MQDVSGEKQELRVDWQAHPVLRHPLSGVEVPLSVVPKDEEELRAAVKEVLTKLKGNASTEEQLALALWRLFPDKLVEELGPNALLFPAEPRIPDHAVWEHLSLTSALTTAGLGGTWNARTAQPSNAALFLFTIGPVQGFIGAARKTRDLQAGSFLLSYLTWQAIRMVCKRYGPEAILFPDLRGQALVDHWLVEKGVLPSGSVQDETAATIPNRFFAVIPGDEAEPVAKEAEEAVRKEFRCIGKHALNAIEGKLEDKWKDRVNWEAYENQLHDYFECYWAALPLRRFGEHDPKQFLQGLNATYAGFLDWEDKKANAILEAFQAHGCCSAGVLLADGVN